MTNEEKILKILEKMQAQMDDRFSQIDDRFSQIDDRFSQMDDRLEKLESDISAVRILVDVDIERKLNLLSEGHQTLLETLAPKDRVEQLEDEVSTLKTFLRILAEKVEALEAAG